MRPGQPKVRVEHPLCISIESKRIINVLARICAYPCTVQRRPKERRIAHSRMRERVWSPFYDYFGHNFDRNDIERRPGRKGLQPSGGSRGLAGRASWVLPPIFMPGSACFLFTPFFSNKRKQSGRICGSRLARHNNSTGFSSMRKKLECSISMICVFHVTLPRGFEP